MVEDGLDGVHAVFSFLEDDVGIFWRNLIGYFQGFVAILFIDFKADAGLGIVEGGQAVENHHIRVFCLVQKDWLT